MFRVNPARVRPCPVCGGRSVPLDVVDFNKSCEEQNGKFLPLSGRPIYYNLCEGCGFCHAPEMHGWTLEMFADEVYNRDYKSVDPDYLDVRPRSNAAALTQTFSAQAGQIRHLDFGGGSGLLSKVLGKNGFNSRSYDPFVDRDLKLDALGQFDLVTAYEVFEHVPDVRILMDQLTRLRKEDGLVLFSTLVSDNQIQLHQRLQWWYASPRNGHISLYSRRSLQLLAQSAGLNFTSFSDGFHVFWRTVPPWARHVLRQA